MTKRLRRSETFNPAEIRSLRTGSKQILDLLVFQQDLLKNGNNFSFTRDIYCMINSWQSLLLILQFSLVNILKEPSIISIIVKLATPVPVEYLQTPNKLIFLDSYGILHASGKRNACGLIPASVKKLFQKGAVCKKYFAGRWQLLILLNTGHLFIFGGCSDMRKNGVNIPFGYNSHFDDSVDQPLWWKRLRFSDFTVEKSTVSLQLWANNNNRTCLDAFKVTAHAQSASYSFILRGNTSRFIHQYYNNPSQ